MGEKGGGGVKQKGRYTGDVEAVAFGLTFGRGGAWRPLAGSGKGGGLHLARVG